MIDKLSNVPASEESRKINELIDAVNKLRLRLKNLEDRYDRDNAIYM